MSDKESGEEYKDKKGAQGEDFEEDWADGYLRQAGVLGDSDELIFPDENTTTSDDSQSKNPGQKKDGNIRKIFFFVIIIVLLLIIIVVTILCFLINNKNMKGLLENQRELMVCIVQEKDLIVADKSQPRTEITESSVESTKEESVEPVESVESEKSKCKNPLGCIGEIEPGWERCPICNMSI